jgi:uncharacterized damage-inducible protein DinB
MTKRAMLLKALSSAPADLALLVQNVADTAVRQRPAPASWSMADVLSHLVDVEPQYLARLQRVVDEDVPEVPRIAPDEAAHDVDTPLPLLLQRFRDRRGETIAFLTQLKRGQWQRKAVHPGLGETTLRYLVQYLVDHDTEHLSQLAQLRQAR